MIIMVIMRPKINFYIQYSFSLRNLTEASFDVEEYAVFLEISIY